MVSRGRSRLPRSRLHFFIIIIIIIIIALSPLRLPSTQEPPRERAVADLERGDEEVEEE